MIPTKGICCRMALSNSMAFNPNEPSPYTMSTCLSGLARSGLDQLLDDPSRIPHDPHVHGAVAPDVHGVDVHLDDLHVGREPRSPEPQTEVPVHTEGKDHVGPPQREPAGRGEEVGVVG